MAPPGVLAVGHDAAQLRDLVSAITGLPGHGSGDCTLWTMDNKYFTVSVMVEARTVDAAPASPPALEHHAVVLVFDATATATAAAFERVRDWWAASETKEYEIQLLVALSDQDPASEESLSDRVPWVRAAEEWCGAEAFELAKRVSSPSARRRENVR